MSFGGKLPVISSFLVDEVGFLAFLLVLAKGDIYLIRRKKKKNQLMP